MQQLQAAKADLQLQSALLKLDKYALLILDDLSYVKKSEAETSVLFELIAHRYELKSLTCALSFTAMVMLPGTMPASSTMQFGIALSSGSAVATVSCTTCCASTSLPCTSRSRGA